jgi:hypothetical protein
MSVALETEQDEGWLYSQCIGGNSQYEAIYRRPDLFENVLCMCSPMAVSMRAIYRVFSELQGVSQYLEA